MKALRIRVDDLVDLLTEAVRLTKREEEMSRRIVQLENEVERLKAANRPVSIDR